MMLRSLFMSRTAWTFELISLHINAGLNRSKQFTVINFGRWCTVKKRIKMLFPLVLSGILSRWDPMLRCETQYSIIISDLDAVKMGHEARSACMSCHFYNPARCLLRCHKTICLYRMVHWSDLDVTLWITIRWGVEWSRSLVEGFAYFKWILFLVQGAP